MSIPKSVIDEVRVEGESILHDKRKIVFRARRVILALAKEMPEGAVGEARKALVLAGYNPATAHAVAEIAISTFLTHAAGDTP